MAPNVEWQTRQIIQCLLQDEDEEEEYRCNRRLDAQLEVDGPEAAASNDDSFDPVLIADKLRSVADALNEDHQFRAALNDLKKVAAGEALNAAFDRSVEAICQTWVAQKAEVASQMQLIRASVAFGLYVKKSSPELKSQVQNAMTDFLNRRVGLWVEKKGGWDKVTDV